MMPQKEKDYNLKIGDMIGNWIIISEIFYKEGSRIRCGKLDRHRCVSVKCKDCEKILDYALSSVVNNKVKNCLDCYRKNVMINYTLKDNIKKCHTYLELKELDYFHKNKKSLGGVDKNCKECIYWAVIWKVYQITKEQFSKILDKQNNKCVICKKELIKPSEAITPEDNCCVMNVDHCHSTGKVRGILCARCNRALGMFDDNEENILRAAEYIKKHKETNDSH